MQAHYQRFSNNVSPIREKLEPVHNKDSRKTLGSTMNAFGNTNKSNEAINFNLKFVTFSSAMG